MESVQADPDRVGDEEAVSYPTELPPFPVDDATLDMLSAAMNPRAHGDEDAESSSVWPFLQMMSQLAGSDTEARAETDDGITVLRESQYTEHCVMTALIEEIRRLRAVSDGE